MKKGEVIAKCNFDKKLPPFEIQVKVDYFNFGVSLFWVDYPLYIAVHDVTLDTSKATAGKVTCLSDAVPPASIWKFNVTKRIKMKNVPTKFTAKDNEVFISGHGTYRVLCEAFNLIGKELTTSSANVTVKVQQVRSSGYTLVSGTLIGLFLVAILIGVAAVVVRKAAVMEKASTVTMYGGSIQSEDGVIVPATDLKAENADKASTVSMYSGSMLSTDGRAAHITATPAPSIA
ncbi:hypothetical protein HELRODRAFT_166170 [Helobdella robusta]|uniref:Ig-like domain-containing protein n=1 Tax=Helobdella robusta TaxID=6412 RepID=T1EXV1_HELRO|nr:hypothetical protein HELRODRAFT_166170 [Helobdella robusta]ESN90499.1 hypothetical protein HELRODRAFT_166170 [Helobdella robusta]